MNPIILSFVSLITVGTHAQKPGHEIHVHSLVQQTDERAGKACNGASTVIVYENASDMKAGGK